jgi:hypothetical protein
MDKMIKTICLVALVLMAITLPAAAIPTVVDSGTSTYDLSSYKILQSKTTWKTSDSGNDAEICAWIRISPSTSMQDGYRPQFTYRIFTPDGKDWFKDINPSSDNVNVDGVMAHVAQVGDFWASDPYSQVNLEYGEARFGLVSLEPKTNTGKPSYQFEGPWKVDMIRVDYDGHTRSYTKVKTLTFNLVNGSTPVTMPPTTTTPTTPQITISTSQKIIVEGESYLNADVQKTGASWDSAVENCPTWRGTDWSGTGDYYLSQGGDSLTYAINAPVTGKYIMWMRDWSDINHAAGDRQVTVKIDGTTIGTFDAASSFNKGTTGYGWDKFTTVDLGAGSHILTITKKDSTSSAAIIDTLWFSSDLNAVPTGPMSHSTSLCPVTTQTSQPVIFCTAPLCDRPGPYVCPQGSTCSGGCGLVCAPTTTPLPKTTTSSMSPAPLIGALGICGIVIAVMRRR